MLVRRDLPASQIAVQAVHAAIEASRQFLSAGFIHPHLVLCSVASEVRLLTAADHLYRHGIRCALFRELDRANEATALATEPITADKRLFLDRFRCLSRQDFLVAPDLEPEPRGSGR